MKRPKKRLDSMEWFRITVHNGVITRHRYLIKLCKALMMYGAPTHRLEEYMATSSRVLEINGQFLYMPNCMIVSFDDPVTHTAEVKLVRVREGIDLGRLRDVYNIYKGVIHCVINADEALAQIEEVMRRDNMYARWMRVPVYGLASACVAPFAFQGRFIDLPLAFVLGCITGLLQLVVAPSNKLYANVFEVSAAVVTSFLARAFGSVRGGKLFCFSALSQSSIALILPGYMVLCGSLELQSQNLAAGSIRIIHALIYTLFLGCGITIGSSLYGMLDHEATSATTCHEPLPRPWPAVFVSGFAVCLCVINQARWPQTPVMVVMAVAGYVVNNSTSNFLEGNNQIISSLFGALTVGILANLYSRTGHTCQHAWLDVLDWWALRARPRLAAIFLRRGRATTTSTKSSDPEATAGQSSDSESSSSSSSSSSPPEPPKKRARNVGYSLAAAAMLPAIWVQVPSGIAAGGSLLAGIKAANVITGNATVKATASAFAGSQVVGVLDGTTFNVLFSVIQVAIGLSVGLFLSALIVYPLGKRSNSLFSF
ncbi:hypothetical protein QBC33DRAFT_575740 [Phialemonium atrogriseum]|uniref:Threonine/serine exporter-like N-terminal domain-containing protein n=1 Tax=Phialemonium atrogriseum TaxID=1093897 RepID=A0AAJ0C8Q0_9PEZI|nr:uncharacterized protein QBC33DRAFT_575740 [Phialemonium atrogriseum]KAK1772015.1 hypothetical protein QBC33DRAFT_575740 [Phialemonium atrogriseum]